MTAKKTPARSVPARPRREFELTPAMMQALMTHTQNLAKARPRQTSTILKLSRAQVAIQDATKPYEQARQDLMATLPPEPNGADDDEGKRAYFAAKAEVDRKFADIYLREKFTVVFGDAVTSGDLQHFTDPPDPNDLAALHPYIVDLDGAEPAN